MASKRRNMFYENKKQATTEIGANCCHRTGGSCKSACEQLHRETTLDPETKQQRLLDVHNFCLPHMTAFWRCMNDTQRGATDPDERHVWSGKSCCNLAQAERCHRACKISTSPVDLHLHCRHSDEISLFSCIDKHQKGEDCCGMARNPECHTACRRSLGSSLSRSHLNSVCGHNVIQCVNNISKSSTVASPHKYLHCCERSSDYQCRETCRYTLRTLSTDQEISESMQNGGCGPVDLKDKFWQCFLVNDQAGNAKESQRSQLMQTGLDSAKLHCCFKAVTHKCMILCTKMFSTEWAASWKIFDEECLTPIEENLAQCIDEVDEPCELGCEGLSYCTTFNNRPTELFRSCDYESDSAARIDVGMWQQRGYVTLPTIQKLFIRNISNCSPIMWKTIACTLQIKPCHRQSHVNRICWEDCFSVLSACLDWEMMGETTTVAKVCLAISVRETDAPCISLDPYLSPSINPYMDAVTRPCKTYPCGPSQVCHVNRSCDSSNDCKSYFCSPGCKLGEMSLHVVPAWTYVRIPTGSGQKGCYRVCQCTLQGTLSPFKEVTCITPNGCKVGDKEHDHGSVFYNDCNMCTCYAGEITCTKKQCKISSGVANTAFTSLPCNCPQAYVPVCAWNGITYPSSCLAKCSELSAGNFLYETCESKDPCASNPCSQSEICVPKRKVCLSKLYNICTQYVCVNPSDSCNHLPDEPVCDTNGEQHSNLCFMLRHKKQLAYHGPCLPGCNNSGEVCGVDGTTYQSECLALSRMISIDYSGPCITVGLINENPQQQCANFVECPPLAEKDCLGYTPPGACCPICAGAVKMLFSQKQIDRALHALNGQPIEAFTVEAIIRGLQRQVGVAECSVRGHLTLEGDILVLVVPTVVGGPSVLRFEACLREAEKLAILVQRESPRIVSELSLSVLTAATIVHQHVPAAALSASMPSLCTLISSSALLLISRLAFNLMLAV